ncbi:MAG: hypothetical protein ACR2QM_17045, partial [Longimicrobiales bacterium]
EVTLRVWGPASAPSFRSWAAKQPNLIMRPGPIESSGWNIKPTILSTCLSEGAAEAIWIDADVIVARDFRERVRGIEPTALIATEEPHMVPEKHGSVLRTKGLGLEVGRALPVTINSCFLRVTPSHMALLDHWRRVLESSDYAVAQTTTFLDRPLWFGSDQDVLTGLLGAREHADLPLIQLRRGKDVAHCLHTLGYTTSERLSNAFFGLGPLLVHTQGVKPWSLPQPISTELSPYNVFARDLESEVEEELEWARPRTRVARVLDGIFRGNAHLRGLPLTLARELQWHVWEGRRA